MTKERRNKLMFRWSVFSAALIAAFWIVLYFTTGSVPVVESITCIGTVQLELLFALSRWFDVILGPIGSVIFVFLFYRVENSDLDSTNKEGLILGLIAGPAFGLVFGLVFGLAFGLVFGLIAGLIAGLIVGLIFGLIAGLIVGLIAGLIAGLIVGLIALVRPLSRWLSAK